MKTKLYITNPLDHAAGEEPRFTLFAGEMDEWFAVKEIEIDVDGYQIDLMAYCVQRLDDLEAEAANTYREKMDGVNEKRAALELVNE